MFWSALALWFAYDGWLDPDPELVQHRAFNRVGTAVLLAVAFLAARQALGSASEHYEPQSSLVEEELPPELDRWNWGAFLACPLWALGNRVWWGLLCIVPYVGWALSVYLGWRGNRHAWRTYAWSGPAEFADAQRAWRNWSGLLFLLYLLIGLAAGARP